MRDEQQWEELIPPRDNIMLEGFTLFTDWLVVEERQRGLTSLRQINRKTREVIGIAFDDPAYVTGLPTIQNLARAIALWLFVHDHTRYFV